MPLRSGHETPPFPLEGRPRYLLGSILLRDKSYMSFGPVFTLSKYRAVKFLGFEFLHARDSNTYTRVTISLVSRPPSVFESAPHFLFHFFQLTDATRNLNPFFFSLSLSVTSLFFFKYFYRYFLSSTDGNFSHRKKDETNKLFARTSRENPHRYSTILKAFHGNIVGNIVF